MLSLLGSILDIRINFLCILYRLKVPKPTVDTKYLYLSHVIHKETSGFS